MKLLLLSNSTNFNEPFLEYPKSHLKSFLGNITRNILFIPYAAVTISYDTYEQKVKEKFLEFGLDIISIHHATSPIDAVFSADAIVIGGGNTFHLLKQLQDLFLLDPIRKRVNENVPYIGWSAGANMACPTISTTNDMPVIETKGYAALDLVPFQINPHYTDFVQPGHGGESRDQRIEEYLKVHPAKIVVGLPEGCMLKFENERLHFIGNRILKVFRYNQKPLMLEASADINTLLMN